MKAEMLRYLYENQWKQSSKNISLREESQQICFFLPNPFNNSSAKNNINRECLNIRRKFKYLLQSFGFLRSNSILNPEKMKRE